MDNVTMITHALFSIHNKCDSDCKAAWILVTDLIIEGVLGLGFYTFLYIK